MSGQNMKMVLGYKQFLSTWPNPNKYWEMFYYILGVYNITYKAIYSPGGEGVNLPPSLHTTLHCKTMTPDIHTCGIMSSLCSAEYKN